MHYLKKYKWTFIPLVAVLAIGALLYGIRRVQVSESTFQVRYVNFDKYIETKGEIHGKDAFFIVLDDIFKENDLRLSSMVIRDMVPEGTIVEKGDWVATLDQAQINQRIQENRDELERRRAFLNDAKIDSTITLTNLRQRIAELEFDLQYRKLDLDQAQYESPAYQRRIQTTYNQTVRQIDRAKRDYELRRMDLANRIRRSEDRYNQSVSIDERLAKALAASRITTPQPGIVVYTRARGNRKIRVGDEISPWRPQIVSIPDLSVMVSETYVEEIDIAKIKMGDSVIVNLDAMPGSQIWGRITSIANVGQDLTGFESKVFAVTVELSPTQLQLLPGMTSTNQIILERIPNQLAIPRSTLFVENNKSIVYLKRGSKVIRQEVITGAENDESIVILQGLQERDRILTAPPENPESLALLTVSAE